MNRSRIPKLVATLLFVQWVLPAPVASAAPTAYRAVILQSPNLGVPFPVQFQANDVAHGQAVGGSSELGGPALLWPTPDSAPIDLTPATYVRCSALGTDGTHQVGYGVQTPSAQKHAMAWTGSPNTARDLNPPGYQWSIAYGVGGQTAAGLGVDARGVWHAIAWDVTTGQATDLTPSQASSSHAWAGDAAHQAGYVFTGGSQHAAVWSGSAASFRDLAPANSTASSQAYAVSGPQVVGLLGSHAALWQAPDYATIDLGDGVAQGTNGTYQVGTRSGRATRWDGSAASAFDLSQFLPPEYATYASYATGIDSDGNIVGSLQRNSSYPGFAVMWIPLPEPNAASLLALPAVAALSRPRRHPIPL